MAKKPSWFVSLPDGKILVSTKSDSAQSAVCKGMMMDLPLGCRVDLYDDEMNKLPNPYEE